MVQVLKFFTRDTDDAQELINHLLDLGLYTDDPDSLCVYSPDSRVYQISVYTAGLRGKFGVYPLPLYCDSENTASLNDLLALTTKEELWDFINNIPYNMQQDTAIDPEDKAEEPEMSSAPTEEHSIEVTIFFPNGAEKTFSKVTEFELITPSGITLKYIEEVSGKRFHKEALFYTDNIAGYTNTTN